MCKATLFAKNVETVVVVEVVVVVVVVVAVAVVKDLNLPLKDF